MRNAPSQLVFFSLRNGVMPPSGHEFRCGPLSVEYVTNGVVRDAEFVEIIEHLANQFIVIDHGVVIGRLPSPSLTEAAFLGVCREVHVRGIEATRKTAYPPWWRVS